MRGLIERRTALTTRMHTNKLWLVLRKSAFDKAA
jgi:hypothetical protein